MTIEWIISACVGVGLAACCGFRIFVPLLIASAATKLGLIGPVNNFEWLSAWPTLIGLSVATVFEIGAYYIPWLDNLLDTLATPVSVIAGTLLSTSFLHIDNPILHWGLGLMLGGGSAGIVQAGTSLLRLGSTATTGGVANPAVATGENIASLGLSLLTVLLPLVAAVVIAIVLLFIIGRLVARRKIWFTRPSKQPQAGGSISQIPRSSNGRS
ncbi:DUF4126 domain-containing protein [Spirosoma soli]|uniref:DUF4126 domain-containing protein n=1 Tax=Spirosoma soli TaxID=1770529 RepID=A0ABW5M0X5_9BACT